MNSAAGRSRKVFLTAEWRHLAMVSYRVDPTILHPYVPAGTELDLWNSEALVSVIGFRFLDTRVLGIGIPFHRNFDEVNLRFYVRSNRSGQVRHGVTFLRELVPRRAIAAVGRAAYNEPYIAVPMLSTVSANTGGAKSVEYRWKSSRKRGAGWCGLRVEAPGTTEPAVPLSDSQACFVSEHYWGYTRQRDGRTLEYEVEHARWRVWPEATASLEGDLTPWYGPALSEILRAKPCSVCLAEGSAVKVFKPTRL